jgi:acetylornithine deacetylase/succinyl-diaminopimelate desuccinylase-like protein
MKRSDQFENAFTQMVEQQVDGVIVGDGNILMSHGIPTVQYGAGDIRIYKEWPTPDERVPLNDLVTAARAIAYATHQLCA